MTRTLLIACFLTAAAFARRKATTWYLGILNGDYPNEITIPLSFLDERTYGADFIADTPGKPDTFHRTNGVAAAKDSLNIAMPAGGGYVARFKRNG